MGINRFEFSDEPCYISVAGNIVRFTKDNILYQRKNGVWYYFNEKSFSGLNSNEWYHVDDKIISELNNILIDKNIR